MAEDEPTDLVICDAGPLIHLDELGCLNLLRDFRDIQVPEAVWQEVERHRPSALRRRKVKLNRVEPPESSPQLVKLAQSFLLGPGELAALTLMEGQPSAVLLTDDSAARLVAERLQFEVHGTIGILLRGFGKGQRTKRQMLGLLRRLPQRSTLFIDRSLLAWVIAQVEGT